MKLLVKAKSDKGNDFEMFQDENIIVARRVSDGDETRREISGLAEWLASSDAVNKAMWQKALSKSKKGSNSVASGNAVESTVALVTSSVKHGAKVAAAAEAADAVYEVAVTAMGGKENLPEPLRTEQGKAVVEALGAVALHLACTSTDLVPSGDNVAAACGLVIEANARDVLQPLIGRLRGKLGTLARIGAGVLKGGGMPPAAE